AHVVVAVRADQELRQPRPPAAAYAPNRASEEVQLFTAAVQTIDSGCFSGSWYLHMERKAGSLPGTSGELRRSLEKDQRCLGACYRYLELEYLSETAGAANLRSACQ